MCRGGELRATGLSVHAIADTVAPKSSAPASPRFEAFSSSSPPGPPQALIGLPSATFSDTPLHLRFNLCNARSGATTSPYSYNTELD